MNFKNISVAVVTLIISQVGYSQTKGQALNEQKLFGNYSLVERSPVDCPSQIIYVGKDENNCYVVKQSPEMNENLYQICNVNGGAKVAEVTDTTPGQRQVRYKEVTYAYTKNAETLVSGKDLLYVSNNGIPFTASGSAQIITATANGLEISYQFVVGSMPAMPYLVCQYNKR